MKKTIFSFTLVAMLTACATKPPGPSVAVMPAPGKPFDVFRFEDYECRQFAESSMNGRDANSSATADTAKTAAVGAALGAVAGVLMGDSGRSAATGAGIGLVGGALAGTGAGSQSSNDFQRRYDIAYQQCMYSKGNQIPGYRTQPSSTTPSRSMPPPPPPPVPK